MVDSHALVGSCAQIGERVHLSAAAQIGGVLEPVNAAPVVIEDDVLVGGNCGVYEGTIVRARAVLAAGVVLTRGTPVFDLVHERIYRGERGRAARDSGGRGRRARARGRSRSGWGAEQGLVAADAGHREVPRREDRPRDRARGVAAMTVSAPRRRRARAFPATSRSRTASLICSALADGDVARRGDPADRPTCSPRPACCARSASTIPALGDDFVDRGRRAARTSRARRGSRLRQQRDDARGCSPASSPARACTRRSSATRA